MVRGRADAQDVEIGQAGVVGREAPGRELVGVEEGFVGVAVEVLAVENWGVFAVVGLELFEGEEYHGGGLEAVETDDQLD